MALVPFADVFNHKAAIVSLSGDYALEGACLAEDGFEGNSSDKEPSEEGMQVCSMVPLYWTCLYSPGCSRVASSLACGKCLNYLQVWS